ncbi:MAG: cupin domain-containing protein [Nitrososphaeria archaeon]|nr:cupin domain-containing protein [Nitrososphaeria archaeon]NIN52099.1 cupin domain-containing protein [Nitrososphaeria archaeon]NIQ32561.1 cupin domain-containing protein [Nitrososphaeria archaeon]
MKVFNYRDVEAELKQENIKTGVRWLITQEMGAENFSMRLIEMDPGGQGRPHSHPWEHEVFVLEGRGSIKGEEEREFGDGDVIFIPPNESHHLKNIGDKTLKFICIIPILKEEPIG